MKKPFRIFAVLIFSLLMQSALIPIFAQSEEEKVFTLSEIDELIEKTEFNRALYEVSVYMKTYPDDFDRAQLRVERILKERLQYNIKSEELVKALEEVTADKDEDELNVDSAIARDEQKLEMISAIEELEVRQSKAQKEFTNQARRTISMAFYLRQFNRIMNAGKSLSDEGNFKDSMLRYKSGFNSIVVESGHDKIFYDDDGESRELPIAYNDVMVGNKNVDQLVTEIIGTQHDPDRTVTDGKIYEITKDYEAVYAAMELSHNNFINAVNRNDIEGAKTEFTNLEKNFKDFATIRNELFVQAEELERLDEIATQAIRKKYNVEQTEADISNSYISFAAKFIKGDETVPGTGMIAAMDMSYGKWVEELKDSVNTKLKGNFAQIEKQIPPSNIYANHEIFEPNINAVTANIEFSPYGSKIQSLYDELKNPKTGKMDTSLENFENSLKFSKDFSSEVKSALTDAQILSSEKIFENTDDINAQIDTALHFEEILNASSNPTPEFIGNEKRFENSYFESEPEKVVKGEFPIAYSDKVIDFRSDIDYYDILKQRNTSKAQERAGEVWGNIATLFAKKGSDTRDEYRKHYTQSKDIMDGTNESGLNPDAMDTENEIVIKDSRGAYDNAKGLNEKISALENDISEWNKSLARGQRFASTQNELRNGIANLNATRNSLEELRRLNSELMAEASRRVQTADSLIASGKEHFRLMEAAANRFDYDESSNQYEQALKDYYDALDYQYSEELVKLIQELNALRSKVREIEVDEALAQVEQLKRQANEYIIQGNFSAAVAVLNQAKNLLAKKNIDADAEVDELLLIIKDLLQSEREKTLSLQNPHYAELSKSLDEGHKDYNAGVELKKEGKASEAKKKFEDAKSSINNVLNEQPYNDEARDILFQTEYELNPGESFRTQFFEPKFREAEKEKDLDTLRDLAKFIPDYPGLKELIRNLENASATRTEVLKKRVDPNAKSAAVDSKQTAEANRLAQEAQRIYSAANGNEAQLAEALRLANQALVIDSKNATALSVSSAVRRARATASDSPLTVAQTRLLTAARNLRNSAPEKAMEYMQQLMGDLETRRYEKIFFVCIVFMFILVSCGFAKCFYNRRIFLGI